MCTWETYRANIAGSAKGVEDWTRLTAVNVFYDHPANAPFDHALILDFVEDVSRPGRRISVELSATAASELLRVMHDALSCEQARLDLVAPDSLIDGSSWERKVSIDREAS